MDDFNFRVDQLHDLFSMDAMHSQLHFKTGIEN